MDPRLIAASCVLALGVSAQAIDFSLKPVSASTPHGIDGNQITVFSAGGTVTLEIRLSNWDPDLDGQPLLRGCQARIDPEGYASGTTGTLGVTRIPCDSDADCPGSLCAVSTHVCEADESAWIDTSRPDYVFFQLSGIVIVGTTEPDFLYASVLWNIPDSLPDPGSEFYLGTLVLEVSDDALGTFTVGFVADDTFGIDPTQNLIPVDVLTPVRITVVRDCNLNGVDDEQEIAAGSSDDCNGNDRPDECEVDCNGNGVQDDCDIVGGASQDLGGNGVPDECDPDCNENGAADDGDIALGISEDCNGTAVPDECEPGGAGDCDGDGASDLCELFTGSALDCNGNGAPDDCDIADGASEDCIGNGVPDECEPDCNRNDVADVCDLAAGYSLDEDGNGVPDDCFRGIALVPVGASVPHQIEGNEILVPAGGAMVTLDVRIAGWGRLDPLAALYGYNLVLETEGFTSGQSGSLSLAALPCEVEIDCFSTAQCLPEGLCEEGGALYLDVTHPNAVFHGLEPFLVSVMQEDVALFSAGLPSVSLEVADPGTDRLAATIQIEVSPDAAGTFTLELRDGQTQWFGGGDDPEVFPALITVLTDCNGNSVADAEDIVAGTSQDADGNGVPDECELAVPFAAAIGSRHLSIIPQAGTEPVAVYVSSVQFPCVRRYVVPGAHGMAELSDSPVFLPPDAWGALMVGGDEVVPGAAFEVQAQFADGRRSWAATASTWRWGDADGNHRADVLDISLVVNVIKGVDGAEAARAGANVFDCDGAGVVNVLDISGVVDAIKGRPYPCDVPCL